MKTAISVPDQTFDEVTRRARELGMSRSEFFARAASRYLDELSRDTLTTQIDEALDVSGSDDSNAAAAEAGRRRLGDGETW